MSDALGCLMLILVPVVLIGEPVLPALIPSVRAAARRSRRVKLVVVALLAGVSGLLTYAFVAMSANTMTVILTPLLSYEDSPPYVMDEPAKEHLRRLSGVASTELWLRTMFPFGACYTGPETCSAADELIQITNDQARAGASLNAPFNTVVSALAALLAVALSSTLVWRLTRPRTPAAPTPAPAGTMPTSDVLVPEERDSNA